MANLKTALCACIFLASFACPLSAVEPPARCGHSMVALGEAIYLFGGTASAPGSAEDESPPTLLNDLWRWQEGQGWEELSPPGAQPSPRCFHAAAAQGGKMFVFFGQEPDGHLLPEVWAYDPSANAWTRLPFQGLGLPEPRVWHTAISLGNWIYLFGGAPADAYLWVFNPAAGTWSRGAGFPETPPFAHAAAAAGGKLWVFGGFADAPRNWLWRYDPETQTWRDMSDPVSCPYPLLGASAVGRSGDLWILGGADSSGTARDQAWRYSTSAVGWFPAAPLPGARSHHAACLVPSQRSPSRALVFGGLRAGVPIGEPLLYGLSECSLSCAAQASPSEGPAPLPVDFEASVEALGCQDAPAFLWDFGDGETSAEPSPSHTYASPGTYAWSVAVTAGGQACGRSGSVRVTPPCLLACSAGASPAIGEAPLPVQFTSTVSVQGCPLVPSLQWDFGDGQTSTVANPVHTYAGIGTYSWSFTATAGGVSCTRSGTVAATGPCTVDCTATALPAEGPAPLAVGFAATVLAPDCPGDPAFSWSFGDGQTSQQEDPFHVYGGPGIYSWSVAVTVSGKTCTRSGTVTVLPPCQIQCSATVQPAQGTVPLTVRFSATADAENCTGTAEFSWSFGDGETSADRETLHVYPAMGHFAWSLIVTNSGATCALSGAIDVRPPPGDADGDGLIAIWEVQQAIAMFLGILPPANGVDCDGSGTVSLGELQNVVNGYLGLPSSC